MLFCTSSISMSWIMSNMSSAYHFDDIQTCKTQNILFFKEPKKKNRSKSGVNLGGIFEKGRNFLHRLKNQKFYVPHALLSFWH